MKKIIMVVIFCLMCVGCGKEPISKVTEEPITNQVVNYYKGEVILRLVYTDDFPDGFEFQFELNGYGLGEFARFEDDSHKTAIGQENEDGHSYYFTIKADKVIVAESDGQNSLGIDLSGEYIKK
ncbi:hypothetical protein [Candidatus Stoquefichus sp. SB1]|uniref:hypothetical protein n=1 Tax=Candidatus Stoquefichus sp. SB1 TaxID=1658109 RepID=UPI00067F1234|nr:hypothetical protein [Candidatus Stoquefichus sp. SB1]